MINCRAVKFSLDPLPSQNCAGGIYQSHRGCSQQCRACKALNSIQTTKISHFLPPIPSEVNSSVKACWETNSRFVWMWLVQSIKDRGQILNNNQELPSIAECIFWFRADAQNSTNLCFYPCLLWAKDPALDQALPTSSLFYSKDVLTRSQTSRSAC